MTNTHIHLRTVAHVFSIVATIDKKITITSASTSL